MSPTPTKENPRPEAEEYHFTCGAFARSSYDDEHGKFPIWAMITIAVGALFFLYSVCKYYSNQKNKKTTFAKPGQGQYEENMIKD
jgi:heme/copper-type cytochrome/quinol oxidase subunit 3